MFKLTVWSCSILLIAVLNFNTCNTEQLIIDTDAGADDAVAILLHLRAETLKNARYKVVAITCTYGNTEEENVESNVLKTLTVANREDIPVYSGAKKPLVGNFTTDGFFGSDGFGDVIFDQEINGQINDSMMAPMALIELSKTYKDDLSILAIGPLTNIAIAATLDPDFISRVKSFYVMGGSVSGIGLVRPNVEFNFGADPEAAFTVFNSTTSSQLSLLPWETVLNTNISKNWRYNVFGCDFDSPYISFLNAIEEVSLEKSKNYQPADAATAAAMIIPEIIKSTLKTNIQPVFDGAAKGSLLVDYSRTQQGVRPLNAKIIQSIDAGLFKKILIYFLSCKNIPCDSGELDTLKVEKKTSQNILK